MGNNKVKDLRETKVGLGQEPVRKGEGRKRSRDTVHLRGIEEKVVRATPRLVLGGEGVTPTVVEEGMVEEGEDPTVTVNIIVGGIIETIIMIMIRGSIGTKD